MDHDIQAYTADHKTGRSRMHWSKASSKGRLNVYIQCEVGSYIRDFSSFAWRNHACKRVPTTCVLAGGLNRNCFEGLGQT